MPLKTSDEKQDLILKCLIILKLNQNCHLVKVK